MFPNFSIGILANKMHYKSVWQSSLFEDSWIVKFVAPIVAVCSCVSQFLYAE